MHRKQFIIELLQPVIMSERAANEGGHSSLDYLSGASLLGAVASCAYDAFNSDEQYQLFHSGLVRFNNALPLTADNKPTYPIPLCWHYEKETGKATDDTQVIAANIRLPKDNDEKQLKQLRGGYVSISGDYLRPDKQLRMKTAIDNKTGRARENALFGYTSLPAGLRFGFVLEADSSIDKVLFDTLCDKFTDKLRLGRSRSAEYGLVSIKSSERADAMKPPQAADGIRIWLLADAALQDKQGRPLLMPTATSIGLPKSYELELSQSFIRTRRYSPFNSNLKKRELERQVLAQGSVLYFNGSGIRAEQLEALQNKGIGLYRQAGLGRIWVNPPLLQNEKPKFEGELSKLPAAKKEPLPEKNEVARWLKRRIEKSNQNEKIEKLIEHWLQELRQAYYSAKALEYAPAGVCIGPSPTQWSRVMDAAKQAKEKDPNKQVDALYKTLFADKRGELDHSVCKENDPAWGTRIFLGKGNQIADFRQWLIYCFETIRKEHATDLPLALARLAHHIRGWLIQECSNMDG
jgi:hypothetical protein